MLMDRQDWQMNASKVSQTVMLNADILIIDDQYDNLVLLDQLLTQNGYQVRVARDGSAGMKAVRAQKPDLIVLDVRLPGMNGFEVCAQLKADPELSDIPVLFISAIHDVASKLQAFEAGGVDYITKPIQAREVLARVETHLTLAHLRLQEKELVLLQERQRLARDLHDSVKQTLFIIGSTAEALQLTDSISDPNISGQLEKLRTLAQVALSEMNIMLYELRPQKLAESPLDELLHEVSKSLSARTRAEITVTARAPRQQLPPPVKTTFYRVAQEALTNAARHAGASRIDLMLIEHDSSIELTVQDDGLGFDVDVIPTAGFGIHHMRERAMESAASLVIESQPGRGTTVKLIWSRDHGE